VRLLLDTHALVWWWTDDPRLPQMARTAIANPENTIVVSAVSAWEIATKHRLGKWPEVAGIIEAFESNVLRSRFASLAISVRHARLAGLLDGPHRDPFDRMLIAQARAEDVPIVSRDKVFDDYGVVLVWDAA
jgi:PIN domain nuclease of toxin-antitoxin system